MSLLSSPDANDLIASVRSMLSQPSENNSFWSDDELLAYMNAGIKRYFALIVQFGQGQFTSVTDLDITANQETVALPSDFFMVKSLARAVSNGYEVLEYHNNLTAGWNTNASNGPSYMPYYYLRGNNLVLRPVSNASEAGALRLEYVAFPTILLNGGDSLSSDITPVFRELIEMYAVYRAKLKESLVTGVATFAAAKQEVGELATELNNVMAKRSMGPTFTVQFNPEEF